MCLIGVLRGVLKRVNGAVAPGVVVVVDVASSPWPSCLAASLTSLLYSSMLSLAGSKEKALHLSCRCLIFLALGREIPTKVFGKLFPITMESISV